MHLQSLTLKGFKSFASPTTFVFEPGITCVVGPNGSGKSNVVDAIAWVLGEQGAKALRGGKMEDVVFAGTPTRPALGRAEVTLTIDNTDGALPIDYAEVSVRRLMFRSGESEYSINGDRCRLVDVQELMSDSGIGRELHVVVGQGQLDAVLSARPEDRRAFIEEAAGVLKHKKRKERALRKLDAMGANLARVTDLTAELQRQLKPLGRQADVARRAATVQADLRDARLRLLADDLVTVRTTLEAEVADETAARARRELVERELAAGQQQESTLEQQLAEQSPRLAEAQETWYALSALQERLRGTATLAAERRRHLSAVLAEQRTGRDPAELEREAAAARAQEQALLEQASRDTERLQDAVTRRTGAEAALATEEKALVLARRAVADRREGLARLTGQVGALRSRASAAEAELGRLASARQESGLRVEHARRELAQLQTRAGGMDAGEVDLDTRHEQAEQTLASVVADLEGLRDQERSLERERSTWAARRDALATTLTRKDGSGALLSAGLGGVLGPVSALVQVEAGAESAVAAALGAVADAVAVAGPSAAADALNWLKSDDAGRAGLLVGSADAGLEVQPVAARDDVLPQGARWAVGLVRAPRTLGPALCRALQDVVLVEDLATAATLAGQGLRAVTPDGDLLGPDWAVGGSQSLPSLLEVQASVDEAGERHDAAATAHEQATFAVAAARAELGTAEDEVAAALADLHASDAKMAATAEQLGLLSSTVAGAEAEAGRLEQSVVLAEQARDEGLAGLAGLESRRAAAEAAPEEVEPSTAARDRLAAELTSLRAAEVEARLTLRTGEERTRALTGRAQSLERAAQRERQERERLVAVREERSRGSVLAGQVADGAALALSAVAASLVTAAAGREQAQVARTQTEVLLATARAAVRELAAELDRLTDVVHRDEVARAEQRLRVEALEQKAEQEWSVPVAELVASYGPDVPVPGEETATAYDRGEQAKRAATAERALALLGRVNPLALEEYAALQERAAFLSTQLADLKATRRDLLTVVKDVDARIHDVFAEAFADTAREFVGVFATLFPGGEGRLELTAPDDMLTTGIEVLARPAGKKVSRLSLLSGGERSLTAIALLVAIFRARPSPFYVMDEVEAALDDRNLSRLLELFAGLREASQLIVITHQKRTMEIADALYGVTMRGDGVSTVISQRLREPGTDTVFHGGAAAQ